MGLSIGRTTDSAWTAAAVQASWFGATLNVTALDVTRFHEFVGTSVYYAARAMAATYLHKQPVSIVGGDNSAGRAGADRARAACVHPDRGTSMRDCARLPVRSADDPQ